MGHHHHQDLTTIFTAFQQNLGQNEASVQAILEWKNAFALFIGILVGIYYQTPFVEENPAT
eukprot:1334335-Amorphochlora_amoeboformis.AAC.1